MKYSLCLTNYNRYEMLKRAYEQVLDDDRIDEIIISDDNSTTEIWNQVVWLEDFKKVKLFRNKETLGMYRNKMQALSYASNYWAIIFDSDNIMDKSYLDAVDAALKSKMTGVKTIICPSFAKPKFDYRPFMGHVYNKANVNKLLNYPMGECLMNTCNYVLNTDSLPYEYNPTMKATDTIWMNYLFLKAGYEFYIAPGLEYVHTDHPESGFRKDLEYNMQKAFEVKQLILNL